MKGEVQMLTDQSDYEFIKDKIHVMKESYPSLKNKTDDYVFSALTAKAQFYKNPALVLNESDFDNFIVDGQYDGGVDILLSDPNSESSNMIIAQSKFWQHISFDEAVSAITKMVLFYKDMIRGNYEQVNEKVQGRFLSLYSEIGEESKITFVLYTSAPKGGIRKDRLERKFKDLFNDGQQSEFELLVLFGPDIVSEIKESECRRPTVESGKIRIDKRDNYLEYGENAAIVNVSAFSIKMLYAQYNTNLLSRNLRYHVSGRDIDKGINETIRENPESFWLKNNGITIICDEFDIDGKEVDFLGCLIQFKVENKEKNLKFNNNDLIKYFDYDKINEYVTVRKRKNGDRIIPLGMTGSKKLKDIFINMKVPKDYRDNIPVIQFDDEIAWVLGVKTSNTYKVTNQTKNILKVMCKREEL